ncbi:MAG: anti-sigma factor [Betaproteobacteria bacterium]
MTGAAIAPVTEAELLAYVDGQLPQVRHADVEAWLAARPEEAERIAAYHRQDDALRALFDPVLDEAVPGRLRRVVKRRAKWRTFAMAAGFVGLGLAVGMVVGWQLHAQRVPMAGTGPAIARNAAVAHATYSPEVRHPVEVGADQEAHLTAWLSKRLGTTLRAPKLEANGFSLVGGRLLPGEAKPAGGPSPVAQFMYQTKGGRRLTLYIRTEATNTQTAFRYATEGSVGVFYWIDRNVGYALSSADLNREELLAVANSVYKQLNP